MMRKLLLSRQKPAQLIGSGLGAFLGISLLLFTMQAFLDFKSFLTEKEALIHPEYLIINKRISMLSSFSESRKFSAQEQNELAELPEVARVAAFRSNQFPASGSIMNGNRGMAAELFFESVPSEMIDGNLERFKWEIGDEQLPILVPSNYLKLYNFGYAPSQGMPQVSPQTLSQMTFRLRLDSMGIPIYKNAFIAGYTERIPSILVPDNFLEYANQAYAGKGKEAPSRLLVEVKDPSNPAILHYLEDHAYESNQEQLKNARLSSAFTLIGGILAVIALVILLLAFLSFFQYTQLSLQRNAYEIKTLLDLGVRPSQLFIPFIQVFAVMLVGLCGGALLLLWLCKNWLNSAAGEYGIALSEGLQGGVLITTLLIFVAFISIQALGIRKGIQYLGGYTSSSN